MTNNVMKILMKVMTNIIIIINVWINSNEADY